MTNRYRIVAVDDQDNVIREWDAGRSERDCGNTILDLSTFTDVPANAVGLRVYRNHEPVNYYPIIEREGDDPPPAVD